MLLHGQFRIGVNVSIDALELDEKIVGWSRAERRVTTRASVIMTVSSGRRSIRASVANDMIAIAGWARLARSMLGVLCLCVTPPALEARSDTQ